MIKSSYHVTTAFGIPIRLHISLAVMALMVVFAFDGNLLIGLPVAAGLIVSIVLHELGHSLVAMHYGCHVVEIELMLIGGVAKMQRMPRTPMGECWMALAGPAVSLVLGIVGIVAGKLLAPLGALSWIGVSVFILGSINLYLAGFNLLPALPMDGGRVFRALLARKMGQLKATFIAERVGKIVAVLMGITGLFQGHFILIIIAVFVYQAAGREYRMARMEAAMGGEFGYGGDWWRTSREGKRPESDDEVVVSPPPYGRRSSRSWIKRGR